jgi:hypothetical protein
VRQADELLEMIRPIRDLLIFSGTNLFDLISRDSPLGVPRRVELKVLSAVLEALH